MNPAMLQCLTATEKVRYGYGLTSQEAVRFQTELDQDAEERVEFETAAAVDASYKEGYADGWHDAIKAVRDKITDVREPPD